MLGLVHYSDDSEPEIEGSPPIAPPPVASTSSIADRASSRSERNNPIPSPKPPVPAPPSTRKPIPGIRLNRPSRTSPTASTSADPDPGTITPSVDTWDAEYQETFVGLTDDEVFKIVSRVPGGRWMVPPPSSAKPSEALQVKVANFLRMKVEQDRHINTTLLSSTAFLNPHIYAKLVEFVDIDERGSAFPGGGWVTRRGLERRIPEWGVKGLAAQQKAQETAILASQSTGKRKAIDFTTGGSGGSRRRHEGRADSIPGLRNGAAEASRREGDAGRRRDGSSVRYGREGDRDGRRKEKDRRWD